MDPILALRRVHKTYGLNGQRVQAVRDVSLQLEAGEFVALMGPSGCGKSTLLHLAGAMDRPDDGEVWFRREPLHRLSEEELNQIRRSRIGFVFQFFYLLPTMTVEENVELPLLLARRRSHPQRVRTLLAAVELQHRAQALPNTLSGGEMQRAALARALVCRPEVVIADEPTGNLDSDNGARVLQLLGQLTREQGTAVLMATHSRDAAAGASRIVQMKDGQLLP